MCCEPAAARLPRAKHQPAGAVAPCRADSHFATTPKIGKMWAAPGGAARAQAGAAGMSGHFEWLCSRSGGLAAPGCSAARVITKCGKRTAAAHGGHTVTGGAARFALFYGGAAGTAQCILPIWDPKSPDALGGCSTAAAWRQLELGFWRQRLKKFSREDDSVRCRR